MNIICILTCYDTEQKNHHHRSVSLVHPLCCSSDTHPHLLKKKCCTSVLWSVMTLSGFDNQDWEHAVSGWAEVTVKSNFFSQWYSCSWWFLRLCLSCSDTFGYASHVWKIRSVSCTPMLQWLITAIFRLMNLLAALLQTLCHYVTYNSLVANKKMLGTDL